MREKRITRDEVYIAQEAFFTGTAAEIVPIREHDGRVIGIGKRGPRKSFQTMYHNQVTGKRTEWPAWLTPGQLTPDPLCSPCHQGKLPVKEAYNGRLLFVCSSQKIIKTLTGCKKEQREVSDYWPSWVGDMVMAQTLFIELKRQDPEAIIDVLAPAWSAPLLDRMPEVNRGIDMPLGHGQTGTGRAQSARQITHSPKATIRPSYCPTPSNPRFIPFWARYCQTHRLERRAALWRAQRYSLA